MASKHAKVIESVPRQKIIKVFNFQFPETKSETPFCLTSCRWWRSSKTPEPSENFEPTGVDWNRRRSWNVESVIKTGPSFASGLYYKHVTIVNYASGDVNKHRASLNGDARVVIYHCHMFIVQATGRSHKTFWRKFTYSFLLAWSFHQNATDFAYFNKTRVLWDWRRFLPNILYLKMIVRVLSKDTYLVRCLLVNLPLFLLAVLPTQSKA